MAEKVSQVISSMPRSCSSKRSRSLPARVVHISNPTMKIETSATEFRAVVQSLTGRKRYSASGGQNEEMNLYSDNQYSPQVKVPKVEDGLQALNADRKASESALIDHDNATVANSSSDIAHGDAGIFEGLEVQPIQFSEYIFSQYRASDSMETIGDTKHIVFDIFSPSTIF